MPKVDVELVRPFLEKKLQELEAEATMLRRLLGGTVAKASGRGRSRGKMTAAERRAISRRMKKLWAERRKEK